MAENQENKSVDKLLDKGDLKRVKVQGDGREIIVPKEVNDEKTSQQKYADAMGRIAGMGAISGKTSTNDFINLFNYYVNQVLEKQTSERMARYDQMDFITENDAALAMAVKVLNDELLQADVFERPIEISAKNPKFKKAITKLFSDLGIVDILKSTGKDLVRYGDAFWVLDVNSSSGVQKVMPIDPRDVRHRFEFSIAELKSKKNTLKKKFSGLQAIIELGSNIQSRASQFNRVLLGFQVLNTVFPFWQVLHFRNFTTKKNIFPFGLPLYYDSQSEARMYLNAKVIISMLRSSAFVKEHIKVKTGEDMDPSEQWEQVQQVKQMMDLFIAQGDKSSKDLPSFGQKIYFPDGLLEVEKIEAGFNFRDRFEDLQIMREDVFNSTGMPKGYFVGEGGTYVPVKALMQQDKKTARKVFDEQNVIIMQLMKLVETHFTFTKEFDPYEEDYAISLPYPIPDIDDSVIGISQAKMQYATTTIDSLKSVLDITKIPEPVVKNMLLKYFNLTDEEVGMILKQMRQDAHDSEEVGIDPQGTKVGDPFLIQKQQADMASQEPQQVPPEQVPQEPIEKAPARESVEKNGEYMTEFLEAIKKKPLNEAMTEIMDNTIMERTTDETVFMGRHYVYNSYTTQDRNNRGVVSLTKASNKKAIMESESEVLKGQKLKGIDKLQDSMIDRRFLKKKEKIVL